MFVILHVGVSESFDDQLRSILAQLEYAFVVSAYEENGVPFRAHMYVPEVHPATDEIFMNERMKLISLR